MVIFFMIVIVVMKKNNVTYFFAIYSLISYVLNIYLTVCNTN